MSESDHFGTKSCLRCGRPAGSSISHEIEATEYPIRASRNIAGRPARTSLRLSRESTLLSISHPRSTTRGLGEPVQALLLFEPFLEEQHDTMTARRTSLQPKHRVACPGFAGWYHIHPLGAKVSTCCSGPGSQSQLTIFSNSDMLDLAYCRIQHRELGGLPNLHDLSKAFHSPPQALHEKRKFPAVLRPRILPHTMLQMATPARRTIKPDEDTGASHDKESSLLLVVTDAARGGLDLKLRHYGIGRRCSRNGICSCPCARQSSCSW